MGNTATPCIKLVLLGADDHREFFERIESLVKEVDSKVRVFSVNYAGYSAMRKKAALILLQLDIPAYGVLVILGSDVPIDGFTSVCTGLLDEHFIRSEVRKLGSQRDAMNRRKQD